MSCGSRLADLIKDVAPEARDPKVRLAFNLIYPAGAQAFQSHARKTEALPQRRRESSRVVKSEDNSTA